MGYKDIRATNYNNGHLFYLDQDSDLPALQAESTNLDPSSIAYSIATGKIWILDTTHTWQLVFVDTESSNSPEHTESLDTYFYPDKSSMDSAFNDFQQEGHKEGELGFVVQDESHNNAFSVYELQGSAPDMEWHYLTSIIPDADGNRNGGPALFGIYDTYAAMLADLDALKAEGYILNDVGIVLADEKHDGSLSFYKLDPDKEADAAFLYQFGSRLSSVIQEKGKAPTCIAYGLGQFNSDDVTNAGWSLDTSDPAKHLELCTSYDDLQSKTSGIDFQDIDVYLFFGHKHTDNPIGTEFFIAKNILFNRDFFKHAHTLHIVGGIFSKQIVDEGTYPLAITEFEGTGINTVSTVKAQLHMDTADTGNYGTIPSGTCLDIAEMYDTFVTVGGLWQVNYESNTKWL